MCLQKKWCVVLPPSQKERQVRDFARFITFIKLRMASHDANWTPGAHVRFGSLDFIVTNEGELVRALAPQTPPATSLDVIVGALQELQLSALEARASERD
jgi:hypothetical protein